MLKLNRATIFVAATLLAGAASAAPYTGTSADYGVATTSGAERTVVVKPGTKYINVDDGETVQFEVNGQTFDWHFDTFKGESSFKLSEIAPKGVTVGDVQVYVAADPLYRG
jgi:phosphate-selective porin